MDHESSGKFSPLPLVHVSDVTRYSQDSMDPMMNSERGHRHNMVKQRGRLKQKWQPKIEPADAAFSRAQLTIVQRLATEHALVSICRLSNRP